MQRCATLCGVVRRCAALCGVVRRCATLCDVVRRSDERGGRDGLVFSDGGRRPGGRRPGRAGLFETAGGGRAGGNYGPPPPGNATQRSATLHHAHNVAQRRTTSHNVAQRSAATQLKRRPARKDVAATLYDVVRRCATLRDVARRCATLWN